MGFTPGVVQPISGLNQKSCPVGPGSEPRPMRPHLSDLRVESNADALIIHHCIPPEMLTLMCYLIQLRLASAL